MKYEALYKEAKSLERRLETDWAEENYGVYDSFVEVCEKAYNDGEITGSQFNKLVDTALYDYEEELLKPEETPNDGDRIELPEMPFDKVFCGELCHATGFAEYSGGEWWNEYITATGDRWYGR